MKIKIKRLIDYCFISYTEGGECYELWKAQVG